MITRLWPLTLLVTQIALGYGHEIDFKRCKTDTACFIQNSCLKGEDSGDNVLIDYDGRSNLKDGDCSVALQIKALTGRKLHVMMRVKLSGADKIKVDDGLTLEQTEKEFICKPNELTGSPKFSPLRLADKQINEEQLFFCSFIAELNDKTADFTLFSTVIDKPKLTFTKNNDGVAVQYEDKGEYLWKRAKLKCNRDLVSSSTKDHPSDNDILWTEVETVFDDLKCSVGPPSFTLVKKSDPTHIKTSKVICNTGDEKWQYEAEGPVMTDILEQFEVFCSEKVCRQCKSGPTPRECTTCVPAKFDFKETDKDACPTLSCAEKNDKWTTTGTTIIKGKAECKRTVDGKNFTWFVGNTHELTGEVACLEKLNCDDPVDVDEPCKTSPASEQCTIVGLGKSSKISCKTDYKMKLTIDGNKVDAGGNEITCNTETGKYEDKTHSGKEINGVFCIGTEPPKEANPAAAGGWDKIGLPIALAVVGILVVSVIAIAIFVLMKKKKKKKTAPASSTKTIESKVNSEKKTDKSAMKSATSNASTMSSVPGDAPDGSEKKKSSRKSKRDSKKSSKSKKEKFKLEDFETWDNEQFSKKILPNFGTVSAESKTKWLRNHMCRFYAYCNTKKTPESGTFTQYWLLVKRCMDDKCEDAGVWVELWHVAFTMAFSVVEKTQASDEFRLLLIKPFETYMLEYFKKCDLYKRKDEPRSETEMRVICIEILLHTRHPDVTEVLRTLTYNEKLECPLRMLTAACYTRERDEKPATVQIQYKRVLDTAVLDPHIAEGWGTYLQHCLFGLGAFLITSKEAYQYFLFEAVYQFPLQKDSTTERRFSPTDWLYVYKGALLHENSAKIALEMFKKMNDGCLLHIDVLLKKKHEDEKDREKTIEQYKRDMKEFTLLLADLLVGEEEFNEFKPHLRFVILFVGELAKTGEPLNEDRIRERAINMGNMARDRNFAKESVDCLKSIGAKMI